MICNMKRIRASLSGLKESCATGRRLENGKKETEEEIAIHPDVQ